MLPEELLHVANMRSIEKRDINMLNGLLLYVPQHVLVINTPIKNSETVFFYFFFLIFGFILYVSHKI